MADPDHIPHLDGFDELTVRLYRGGLSLAALSLVSVGAFGLAWFERISHPSVWETPAFGFTAWLELQAPSRICIYTRSRRWFIGVSGWFGAILLVASRGETLLLPHGWLGFLVCRAVWICAQRAVLLSNPRPSTSPPLSRWLALPLFFGKPLFAGIPLLLSGLIYSALVVAKWRMPLHFDVGDKSKYQDLKPTR